MNRWPSFLDVSDATRAKLSTPGDRLCRAIVATHRLLVRLFSLSRPMPVPGEVWDYPGQGPFLVDRVELVETIRGPREFVYFKNKGFTFADEMRTDLRWKRFIFKKSPKSRYREAPSKETL
jgi:hypothetical protein